MLAALLSSGALAVSLAACGRHAGAGAAGDGKSCPPPGRASAITGLCLPRYVSLKKEVYARKGPGMDYPALWTYRAAGLPVQIVAETLDWRRICDPYGEAVWVYRTTVDGHRTVLAPRGAAIDLLANPATGAKVAGQLSGGALAALDRCEGAWCRVRIAGAVGWVPSERVWGVAPAAQCR
jgi:SH3-like domain-containing protein